MTQFIIQWAETKTSAKGTNYKRATITDETGKTYENVAVFPTFSKYGDVLPGQTIAGSLKTKDYQGKPSYSLEDEVTYKSFAGKGSGAITKAMETKADNIKIAQGNKELGIKVSSTMRMAVDLAIAGKQFSDDTFEGDIKRWRTWLWNEWDKEDKDFPPFN